MAGGSFNVKPPVYPEGKFTFIYCVQQLSDPFHFDPPGGWQDGADCDVVGRCQHIGQAGSPASARGRISWALCYCIGRRRKWPKRASLSRQSARRDGGSGSSGQSQ
jgi:hypothetical protein